MRSAKVLVAALVVLAAALGVASGMTAAGAAAAPARLTFLAATCPGSSSMYTRVAAGQDPTSNENGSPASPNDIAAYGCTQTTGLSFFELGGSTAGSVFLDSQLTTAFSVSTSASGPAGGPTTVLAGGTTYVPGGVSQVRRFSVNNYPTTVTSRAAMPFLDLQCATDGVNSDNADGAGWNGQSFAADSQNYCIAYIWDGTTPTTPSPTPTATATPTQTPTPQASPTSTATASPAPSVTASASASPSATTGAATGSASVTVNFPGLSDVHVYLHPADGAPGSASGSQVASSTWKANSTTLTAPSGTYDIRVVHGPVTVVIDQVDCKSSCTVDVPLATLTVNFPGMTDVHTYAHVSDGAPGTYGAQDSSSTWKAGNTTIVLLRGMYDIRVVHGPVQAVLDGIDCRAAACSATAPTATLTVNFPGMSDVHTYAHVNDGAAGTFGAQDTSSTWKAGTTSMVLLQGMYDVRVVHGPTSTVVDEVDCRAPTCLVEIPLATLTVSFPGLSDAHSYVHKADGVSGTYGAQDSSSTWKANSATFTLLRALYDVRVVHGPTTVVLDSIDCTSGTCFAAAPMASLTVTFPGLTDAHTYVHATDGAAGTYGAQDSSSTWRSNQATFTLLQAVYDARIVHGPAMTVLDGIDCRSAECKAEVPLAALTVSFPGKASIHTYVRMDDARTASASGGAVSSATWRTNSAKFVLLRGMYDVVMREGATDRVADAVDCRGPVCGATWDEAVPVVVTTPTPVPVASVKKSFVSAADGVVTWRLEPNQPADLLVWDTGISGCEEHEGAACGDITAGGYGKFYATTKGEYLLVTQEFKPDGDACKVTNTAEWATSDSEKRQTVTASYECSGASTMGWSLFAIFATGAAGLAWVVQRKFACQQ